MVSYLIEKLIVKRLVTLSDEKYSCSSLVKESKCYSELLMHSYLGGWFNVVCKERFS